MQKRTAHGTIWYYLYPFEKYRTFCTCRGYGHIYTPNVTTYSLCILFLFLLVLLTSLQEHMLVEEWKYCELREDILSFTLYTGVFLLW